jgi:hypothetical protein
MIGTLTRNTDPYQNRDSNSPVDTGPIAPAAPTTPAQMAIAFVRSWGGNTFTRIERVDGMMNAAPRPIVARAAMSSPIECDHAAKRHAHTYTTRPSCSAPFRPNRSPSAPAVNSIPAKTSEYAAITHCSCDSDACRSFDRVGIATFRLELPTKMMSRLRQSTARIHQRRSWT